MSEDFLHFIWKHRLFREDVLQLHSGEPIAVIDPGRHNTDAGPDFLNARLRFDCFTWAGNIEIHKNASDWYKHNHDRDKSYDNVILHLVQQNDASVKRSNGEEIPTVVMDYDKKLENNYNQLLKSSLWIPCQNKIDKLDRFTLQQWVTTLAIERLQRKTEYFNHQLEINNNHWEETFYQALSRSFGMNVNALPFELLTKSIPLSILSKHRDHLIQLEALLFGQAGFLDSNEGDEYFLSLKKEYQHLKNKYNITPIEKHLWKFLRLRPNNFPTLRIAQLAMMIHHTEFLFSGLIENISIPNIHRILSVNASYYWDTHYIFGKPQNKIIQKCFAENAINTVIINTIVPFLFLYAMKKDNLELKNKALELLENIGPELNTITNRFKTFGIEPINALETQALLEMKHEYCDLKRCLECRIGNKLIISG